MIGQSLPEDYREFMLSDSGATIQEMSYWMPHPSGRWIETVNEVHSLDYLLGRMEMEIDQRKQGFGDHLPGTLPIADNGCGDTVLLSYRDQDFGTVFHEFLEEGDMDDPWRGVYPLASSFTVWVQSLERMLDDQETES